MNLENSWDDMKTSSRKHFTSISVHCCSSLWTNKERNRLMFDVCRWWFAVHEHRKDQIDNSIIPPGQRYLKGGRETRMWTDNHVHIDTHSIRSFRFRSTVIIDPFGVSEKRTSVCLFDEDTWQWFHKSKDNWDDLMTDEFRLGCQRESVQFLSFRLSDASVENCLETISASKEISIEKTTQTVSSSIDQYDDTNCYRCDQSIRSISVIGVLIKSSIRIRRKKWTDPMSSFDHAERSTANRRSGRRKWFDDRLKTNHFSMLFDVQSTGYWSIKWEEFFLINKFFRVDNILEHHLLHADLIDDKHRRKVK